MNTKPIYHWNSLNTAFKALVLVLILLGVFFRFAGLSERPYWHDETYTLLRLSGQTIAQITQQFDGRLLDRSDLLKFQQLTPDKSWFDMIGSLLSDEPHRVPLYYAIARPWMEWFGNGTLAMRSLSAAISLLVFPALYWLCLELFTQPLTAWIALMLMAVSPFHVYYAQEVREYSLWTVIILVMSAALLRAIRKQTKNAWMSYGFSIALSLYTLLLSIPILFGHLIYFLIFQTSKSLKKLRSFLKAFGSGSSLALPWLIVTFSHLPQVERMNAWMSQSTPFQVLLNHWISHFQFIFLKENLTGSLELVFVSAIAFLVLFALKSLIQSTPKSTWGFIVLLILPLFLSAAIPDLVLGGLRSSNARYFVPTYLGIQIAVAHLLTIQLKRRHQNYWKFVLMVILTTGVLSCSAQMIENQITEDRIIANLINRSQSAIVISGEISAQGGGTIGDILAISHLVRPETKFQLVIQPQIPTIPTQKVFEKHRVLHQAAPEWNSGLTVRSPSSGTNSHFTPVLQSPSVDFVQLAPNSIPGRVRTQTERTSPTFQTSAQPDLYLYKPLTYLKEHLQQTYQLKPIYKDKLFQIQP